MKWRCVTKALAATLAVVLSAGMLESVSVQAEELPEVDVIEDTDIEAVGANDSGSGACGVSSSWALKDGVLTISGTGVVTDYLSWYGRRDYIKKVVVENGITELPGSCFASLRKLEEVSLPESLTELPSSAFEYCESLKEITLPKAITKINFNAFSKCTSLTKITAKGVNEIGSWAFKGSYALQKCEFAKKVKIGMCAFEGCSGMENDAGLVIVSNVLCGINSMKAGKELKIPEGVTDIAFYGTFESVHNGAWYENQFTSVSIPSTLCGKLEAGRELSDSGDLVYELLMNEKLEKIEVSAKNPWYSSEKGCLLNKKKTELLVCPKAKKGTYVVPKGVKTIGYAALSRCAYLTAVSIPESVKTVQYLGCTTQNNAPLYFEGNAPKVAAAPVYYKYDSLEAEGALSLLYPKVYDNEEFKLMLEELSKSTSLEDKDLYKMYTETLAGIEKQEIHYVVGSTGWNELKKEYPRIKKWISKVQKISGVKLPGKVSVKKGKSLTLKPEFTPLNASNKTLKWKSANTKVATVSKSGKVEAKAYGTTTISATTTDGSNITAKCTVTVPYNITYKLNKGTNSSKNPAGYYNQKVTLKNPVRKGYAFKGWYTDSKYKNKITSIKKGTKKNYTLYAKWERVSAKATQITSAKNSKSKQLALKYQKVSGVKGYEISYTTDKNLKKSVIRKTSAKTSYTIKNLKKGAIYYVRVRSYKVDSAGKKVYSKYTKTLKLKIKK